LSFKRPRQRKSRFGFLAAFLFFGSAFLLCVGISKEFLTVEIFLRKVNGKFYVFHDEERILLWLLLLCLFLEKVVFG
jgi:hypothetical protein